MRPQEALELLQRYSGNLAAFWNASPEGRVYGMQYAVVIATFAREQAKHLPTEEEKPLLTANDETKKISRKPLFWWRVVGAQHTAIVRAATGRGAVKKALAGPIGEWEEPEASKIGPTLPDVIACW